MSSGSLSLLHRPRLWRLAEGSARSRVAASNWPVAGAAIHLRSSCSFSAPVKRSRRRQDDHEGLYPKYKPVAPKDGRPMSKLSSATMTRREGLRLPLSTVPSSLTVAIIGNRANTLPPASRRETHMSSRRSHIDDLQEAAAEHAPNDLCPGSVLF
jgi:hypothetical protein